MAKKQAQYGEYVIIVEESGSITTLRLFENAKGAMREMCDVSGIEYDNNWTTRQFGSKLFKQYGGNTGFDDLAQIGDYTLQAFESGSYKVLRQYDNVIGSLREIAEKVGFDHDEKWNTRTFGNKLVDFLNKK